MKAIVTLADGTKVKVISQYPKSTTFIAVEFLQDLTNEDYQQLAGALKPGAFTEIWSEDEDSRNGMYFRRLVDFIWRGKSKKIKKIKNGNLK